MDKTLNTLQLIFEVFVLIGYIIALIPFGYLFSVWFVIPLTIVNLVLSLISNNSTIAFTITNVIMAFMSLIPFIGYIFRIVGIIMAILSIVSLNDSQKKINVI